MAVASPPVCAGAIGEMRKRVSSAITCQFLQFEAIRS